MRLNITARHIEVPDQLKELLESKVQKLEQYGHKLLSLHAILGREHYLYTAELTLAIKGATLVGTAKEKRDLLTCVEGALHKLKEQLCRHEEKRMEKLRRLSRQKPFIPI